MKLTSQDLQNNHIEDYKIDIINNKPQDNEKINSLIKIIAKNDEPSILCSADSRNPNYYSIIYANQKFMQTFNIDENFILGKDYDFLFKNINIDDDSEDQMAYVGIIKSVKDFKACEAIIDIPDIKKSFIKSRFKINFIPSEIIDDQKFGIFIFEKFKNNSDDGKKSNYSNSGTLRNLERMLRNERLLRDVANMVVSDIGISDVARKISKILCEHLKVDRCMLHDYNNGEASFIIEHCSNYVKPIFEDVSDVVKFNQSKNYEDLVKYLDFQYQLCEKIGRKDNKSTTIVVEDAIADKSFFAIEDICRKFSIRSQVVVSTAIDGNVNGALYIHQNERRGWLIDEIDLIEMIAEQFSIAIDRSRSIEKIMIANHRLLDKTQQLKEALKEEKNLRRMQNEFVTLISHEFKTPLQIIDSTRELLIRKIRTIKINDESIDKCFDKIKSGVTRMSSLIDSTMNLAKIENNKYSKAEKSNFNFRNFIVEIVEKNSNLLANKNVSTKLDIEQLPVEFLGDSKILDHVFTNVISNAIKYSKDNTEVKISGLISDDGKNAIVKVVDNGIGIPKEDIQNIGSKFFRASNTLAVSGTGIGLYLTKHFIEMHNGDIKIESELNVGTTITISLPIN
jgi:signal transduction histidine kinase